jgi:hypothetical protein
MEIIIELTILLEYAVLAAIKHYVAVSICPAIENNTAVHAFPSKLPGSSQWRETNLAMSAALLSELFCDFPLKYTGTSPSSRTPYTRMPLSSNA